VNDPHRDSGATAVALNLGPACDDVQLLRLMGQGDENAMTEFYRRHGRVVLGGGGYGLTAALTRHVAGPVGSSTKTALTAVSGCTALKEASGTLEQVNGTSLVIKTASGQPVTVTTTASTLISVSGAPLSDITNGVSIAVAGPSSDGTVAATTVVVGWPHSNDTPRLPGGVAAVGTVAMLVPAASP